MKNPSIKRLNLQSLPTKIHIGRSFNGGFRDDPPTERFLSDQPHLSAQYKERNDRAGVVAKKDEDMPEILTAKLMPHLRRRTMTPMKPKKEAQHG